MRTLIILAGALALAACGNNDQSDNTQNVDENLTAENIVSNDVTAIDAVTGDAANMAVESDVNDLGNVSNDTGNASAFPKAKPQTDTPRGSTSTSKPAPSPVENTPSNAVTNGE
jgi:Flp pilus assembly protein TadG